MKKGTVILTAAVVLAGLGACSKASLKATYDKQATYIEGFITAQMKADTNATLVRNGNAFRLTLHDTLDRVFGERDSLQAGGKVALYYACYTLTSSSISVGNLIATNVKSIAELADWNLSDTLRYKLDTLTLDKTIVSGLYDGLQGVQEFDECVILFTGEFGFENAERGTIPARSALAYQFWIENILDNEK